MVVYTRSMKQTAEKENSLESFTLPFIETEIGVAKSAPMKPTFKERVSTRLAPVRSQFNNALSKVKTKRKKAKKPTKAQQKLAKQQHKNVILGIGLLLVIVSIAFSTTVTLTFVNSPAAYIALAPQVAFAAAVSIIAFYNIFKK